MLKKYCNHAGCTCLITANEKYCSKHKHDAAAGQKEYDLYVRDKEGKRFLNSKAWQDMRKRILIRDAGLDILLYVTEGKIVKASHVHHIIERNEDMTLALDENNLISLSDGTHTRISLLYRKDEKTKRKTQEELRKALNTYLQGRGI